MASKYPFDPNDPYRYLLNLEEEEMIEETENDIRCVCEGVASMLIEKNRAYGDSALSPRRIFSRADSVEQLKVRLDDKLSRLSTMTGDVDVMGEDVEKDLMGYLVLLQIARKRKAAACNVASEDHTSQARTMFGAPKGRKVQVEHPSR